MIYNKYISIILILLMSMVSFTWFEGKLINFADFDFSIAPWLDFQKFSYVWIDNDLGKFARNPPKFIFQIPQTTLYYLGFDVLIIEKLLFWFLIFSSGISMYLLLKYFLNHKKFSTISSLVGANLYMFNMYTFQVKWSNGYILSLFTYAILPLIFLYFLKFIQTTHKKYIAYIGILSFIAIPSANNPAHYFPIFALIIFYSIYRILMNILTKRGNIKSDFSGLIYAVVILLLVNSLWILPIFINLSTISKEVKSENLEKQIKIGSASDFVDIFRFLGFWALKGKYKGEPYFPYGELYYTPFFILLGFLISFFAIIALFTNNNKKIIIFFGLVFVISIFLMKGIISPLASINIWLYNNIPGFWAFRQSYEKFGIFFAFSMSVLLGFGIQGLLERISHLRIGNETRRNIAILVVILSFLIINIYAWPFWTGDVFPRYEEGSILKNPRILVPEYYKIASEWINSHEDIYRILGLPSGSRLGWVPYNWGYIGVDPLYHYSKESYIIPSAFNEFSLLQKYEDRLDFSHILYKFIPIMNIRYIVVRMDVDYNFYNWYNSPIEIKEKLDSYKKFKHVKTFDKLYIYEVPREIYLPRIYTPLTPVYLYGNINIEDFIKTLILYNFSINDVFFLHLQLDENSQDFLEGYNTTIFIHKKTIKVLVYEYPKTFFHWNHLKNNSIVAIYYPNWKSVIRTDGAEQEDTLSFSSLESCPYEFPPYSLTGWSAFNSTLVYIKTGNKPLRIASILENSEPAKGIVGIWWETGWVGMGTKPIEFPVIIPPNQRAIVQINHKVENLSIVTIELKNLSKLEDMEERNKPLIIFKRINPTKYIVKVENATAPFFLVFSESFHPQWKVYVVDKDINLGEIIAEYPNIKVKEAKHFWYKFTPTDVTYLLKKPTINETYHFKANGYANAWYIDPNKIEKDGDGKFTIVIYFLPQSFFYLGLFISMTTLILCVSYLFYDWRLGRGDEWVSRIQNKVAEIRQKLFQMTHS